MSSNYASVCPLFAMIDQATLANVFSHLDPYNRSICREVCSQWRDVIDSFAWSMAVNFIIEIDSYNNCSVKWSITSGSNPCKLTASENVTIMRISPNLVATEKICYILELTKPAYLNINGNY